MAIIPRILIIDDEESLRKLLVRVISLEGFAVEEAASLRSGLAILQKGYTDVVLCDVKLPDGSGVDFAGKIKKQFPSTECILLTAYGNIADGVQAIKNGAFDYITKGNDNDRIIPLLHQAYSRVQAQKAKAVSIQESGAYDFTAVTGNSPAIRQALDMAQKIAAADVNVLLLGETGTGKEVFANAIHTASRRAAKPFIAINCSAFTKELLESELFGHKAGAYTGASKDKKGLIEAADKGTLFLDEIGEMPVALQAKLLRVLENGEYIKVGDEKISRVNIRVIAATNRDLGKEIGLGHFREDLYYRLNAFSLILPSLRERMEDIPALAAHFLRKRAQKENTPPLQISAVAIKLLQRHSWKGNIRELKNVLERASVLSDGKEIRTEDLPFEIQQQMQETTGHPLSLAAIERSHIEKVLRYTQGNKTRAAEYLGIGLTTLYRKMDEYHVKPE